MSANNVYVSSNGIPSYPTGPFQDGNPSQAQSQNGIFRFPLNSVKNEGTPVKTTMGNIGRLPSMALLYLMLVMVFHGIVHSRESVGGPIMGKGDGIWRSRCNRG
jgi:hypothetical protein